MALVAGDMAEEAYRKTKAQRAPGPDAVLMSRREHVSMRDGGHGRGHRAFVNVRGKEREISKFRGTEKVDLGGGDGVQVSSDLHHWLFLTRDTAPANASAVTAPPHPAHAVFIFRFELTDIVGEERDSAEVKEKELLENAGRGGGAWAGYLGRRGRGDWSESSTNDDNRRKKGQARRLAKASSSSSASVSSSSASWASGSMVMDWANPKEDELQRGHGFSLISA
ncbi:hypothetical protein E2562_017210 [Oryza meyeriana var. granulata]|uniref:Uncharacterized protein n=1 Tax=Oryza meyeriana var. granulata TaxID=110450 RepID=A0A6G1EM01_9ORYZ|nr:hypothetical protein E2562_017210 [Oryza meyeriana var. granulata]